MRADLEHIVFRVLHVVIRHVCIRSASQFLENRSYCARKACGRTGAALAVSDLVEGLVLSLHFGRRHVRDVMQPPVPVHV